MRSILYIPGNRRDFIKNIRKLNADVYALDIEDSVPPDEKQNAREIIRELLEYLSGNIFVRINDWSTGLTELDLEYVVYEGLDGVCLTKCNEVEDVRKLDYALCELERERGLPCGHIKVHLLIETAKGMMNVYPMAMASKRITALIFGVVDYTSDMMITLNQPNGKEYSWARQMVACAAVAANVTPIDCPYMPFKDYKGFYKDTRYGVSLGYRGRVIIHPSQINMANDLYIPSKESISWAKEIIELFEKENSDGRASVAHNGKMIATAVYRNAQNIIRYANSCGVV